MRWRLRMTRWPIESSRCEAPTTAIDDGASRRSSCMVEREMKAEGTERDSGSQLVVLPGNGALSTGKKRAIDPASMLARDRAPQQASAGLPAPCRSPENEQGRRHAPDRGTIPRLDPRRPRG